MTEFDDSLLLRPMDPAADPSTGAVWHGTTDPRYWNMVGPFGGWVAALLVRAVGLSDPILPVALTVNFLAPLQAGPCRVETRALRQGRSVRYWQASLVQDQADGTVTSAIGLVTLAPRRPGAIEPAPVPPTVPDAAEVAETRRPHAPPFLGCYRQSYVHGRPFRENPDLRSVVWVADREPRPLDPSSLAAFADLSLPRLFLRNPSPVPVATVSLSVYFHAAAEDYTAAGSQPLLMEANGRILRPGFGDQTVILWSHDRRLLATSEQLVWYRT